MIDGEPPDDDLDQPRRRGLGAVLAKVTALVLIIGLLLAFPLGYLVQTLVQHHQPSATLFVVEAVAFGVIVVAIRVSRRL